MQTLYLARHGEAQLNAVTDASRQLTEHGRRQVSQTVEWLARQPVQPTSLWSSPFVRAQQTAEYVQQKTGLKHQISGVFEPESEIKAALSVLNELTDAGIPIVCFHQPLMGRLIEWLTGDIAMVPTASIFQLEGMLMPQGMEIRAHFGA